jgi:hypothetical protein
MKDAGSSLSAGHSESVRLFSPNKLPKLAGSVKDVFVPPQKQMFRVFNLERFLRDSGQSQERFEAVKI